MVGSIVHHWCNLNIAVVVHGIFEVRKIELNKETSVRIDCYPANGGFVFLALSGIFIPKQKRLENHISGIPIYDLLLETARLKILITRNIVLTEVRFLNIDGVKPPTRRVKTGRKKHLQNYVELW